MQHRKYHPDSRKMALASRNEWPERGLKIKSSETKAWMTIVHAPKNIYDEKPWIITCYLEWEEGWSNTWTCRWSSAELGLAFCPIRTEEPFVHGRFCRGKTSLTVPTTHIIGEVQNGDPFLQICLTDEIVYQVRKLMEVRPSW